MTSHTRVDRAYHLAWETDACAGRVPALSLFCLEVSIVAAVVIRLKVRDSAAYLVQIALRQGKTATA